jgi:hypothetical protein
VIRISVKIYVYGINVVVAYKAIICVLFLLYQLAVVCEFCVSVAVGQKSLAYVYMHNKLIDTKHFRVVV